MILVPEYRSGARCVFKSLCDHAPAVERAIHEFANHPDKPVCKEHADRIRKIIK